MNLAALIQEYAVQVAELPDRTSPENRPEAMLITTDELHDLLRDFAGDVLAEAAASLTAESERIKAPISPFA